MGPVITLGQAGVTPFAFEPPNAGGIYAPGRASRYHWGGGAQIGVYYIHNPCWHWGASLKSPAWMEEFRIFSEDANGGPRILHADFDLPMILSVGAAYTGFERWLVAVDARYLDYKNTDGFGEPAVFEADGSLRGLDWSSVFSLAIGAQRQVTERFYARVGYTYNQDPIKNSESFFNIPTPLIYDHMLSVGGSYNLCGSVSVSLAYSYMFPSQRVGPIVLPGLGAIPGSSATNELDVHFLNFGITMRH
jgi:long-chain fatty acid transport protein